MIRRLILVAMVLAGCSSAPGPGATTPAAPAAAGLTKGSGTIVAGESVDAVKVGAPRAEVEKALGGEGEKDVNEFNKSQSYALYKDKGLEIIYDDDKVGMIVCHADAEWTPYTGATKEGLWVGSTKDEIKQALGPPKEDPGQALDYTAQGIWFTFTPEGRVETIKISRPK